MCTQDLVELTLELPWVGCRPHCPKKRRPMYRRPSEQSKDINEARWPGVLIWPSCPGLSQLRAYAASSHAGPLCKPEISCPWPFLQSPPWPELRPVSCISGLGPVDTGRSSGGAFLVLVAPAWAHLRDARCPWPWDSLPRSWMVTVPPWTDAVLTFQPSGTGDSTQKCPHRTGSVAFPTRFLPSSV